MDLDASFGAWLTRRRHTLRLSRAELARRVSCATVTLRKIEEDARRPSQQLAAKLAEHLAVRPEECATFIRVARGELGVAWLPRLARPSDDASRPAPGTPPARLPIPPTPLIGRSAEVTAVRDVLLRGDARLLTLTGAPGIGKTRLSLAVALDLHDAFADGVWFIPLAPLRDPRLVVATVAQTLGIAERAGQPMLERLKAYVRDRQLLLILDNFEQVVAAAPFLAELLAAALYLKVLSTSREVLHLSGEHVVAVPPLTLPDPQALPPLERLTDYEAVRLFVTRAQAAHAGFALTSANAPAIAEICYRLDGLPLAIELAAARMRLLPPQTLLARLTSRIGLLTGGPRDLPARQQTLRSTLDWSYALLRPGEPTLFARLGVFAGGCTLEAAEAVCNTGGDLPIEVLDGLASLVDKSLVQQVAGPEGEPCFTMLETIREYALERLAASGEMERVRQQHAGYYLHLAEMGAPRLTIQERRTWLDRLAAEHDNLRAALAWSEAQPGESETELRLAVALYRFWLERGPISEGFGWLQRALARTDELQQGLPEPMSYEGRLLRARAFVAAGDLAVEWGDLGAARAYFEASLALFRALGDKQGLALVLIGRGWVAHMEGAHPTGRSLTEEGVALLREVGDRRALAAALFQLGLRTRLQGDYARAAGIFTEVVALAREVGDQTLIAWGLLDLGTVALHQGDGPRAVSLLKESVALFSGERNKLGHGWALIHLGEALRVAGDVGAPGGADDAGQIDGLVAEGLALIRAAEARQYIAQALLEVGELAFETGDAARAGALLAESLSLFHAMTYSEGIANVLDMLAGLAATQGRAERAARLWGGAERLHDPGVARLSPIHRTRYERYRAAARAQLDDATRQAAWTEGQAMSLEQAIAYALEETKDA